MRQCGTGAQRPGGTYYSFQNLKERRWRACSTGRALALLLYSFTGQEDFGKRKERGLRNRMAAEWSEWSRDRGPLQGRDSSWPAIPRALPWAGLCWPRWGQRRRTAEGGRNGPPRHAGGYSVTRWLLGNSVATGKISGYRVTSRPTAYLSKQTRMSSVSLPGWYGFGRKLRSLRERKCSSSNSRL